MRYLAPCAITVGMGTDAAVTSELRTIIDAALRGVLTDELARRAVSLGDEATVAVMLAASAHIAELRGALAGAYPGE